MMKSFKIALITVIPSIFLLAVRASDNKVVRIAKNYIGETEIFNNQGFVNPLFQQEMISIGWKKGNAWCMYFIKLVMQKTHPQFSFIKNSILPNSQQTFDKIKSDTSGLFELVNNPMAGDIVIFQYYKNGNPTSSGHGGIVTYVTGDQFHAIEGNTNTNGSNEGRFVALRKRKFIYKIDNGLAIKGFIRLKV